jgi:biotin carboxyl carrier protein
MRRVEVEVGGRLIEVDIEPAGGGLEVTVNGRATHVDVARVDLQTLSLIVTRHRGAAAAAYEVTVTPDPASPSQLTVRVGAIPVTVSVGRRGRRRGADDHAASGSEPQRVTAPMPGKIVRVLVKKGDVVRARQPLVVVEAMKMENELRAARDGTVADVAGHEGQSVDAGTLLLLVQ